MRPLELDPLEDPPAGEAAAIATLIHLLAAEVDAAAAGEATPRRRGGHTKAHGTVRASLTIHGELPPELAVGLFAKPQTYRAWARFSNAWGGVRPDFARDLRGLALTIEGTPGPTLEPLGRGGRHDLLLVSAPRFFFRDAVEFATIVDGMFRRRGRLLRFLARRPRHLLALLGRGAVDDNPLALRYYSVTPYRLGSQVIKYGARPVDPPAIRGARVADGLRQALRDSLAVRPARFSLEVQLRRDPARMPIEDVLTPWDEARAPFVPVATLEIPRQIFDTPARDALGERLDFTPGATAWSRSGRSSPMTTRGTGRKSPPMGIFCDTFAR